MSKFSIITINLNNKIGLRTTINSVINQSFKDYEYIIIDGGSNDGSVDVIKEFNDKITYWISEVDKGIYHAMNKGIIISKGDYILFLNSGDYLYNESVLLNVFKEGLKSDIVTGNTILKHPDGTITYRLAPIKYSLVEALNNGLSHSCTFHKRTLFLNLGLYNENRKIAGDWEFTLKAIIKSGASYNSIPQYISVFNLDGISNTMKSQNEAERIDILREIYPAEIVNFLLEYMPLKIYYEKLSKNGLAQLGIYLSKFGLIRRPINKIFSKLRSNK